MGSLRVKGWRIVLRFTIIRIIITATAILMVVMTLMSIQLSGNSMLASGGCLLK